MSDNNKNNNYNSNIDFNLNLDIESNLNLNSDSESNSDSEEYVDLSFHIESNAENIFQFNLNGIELTLKHIGKCTQAPDIILKENFGPESNMNLFSCVYTQSEIFNAESDELFFPLVRLIRKTNTNVIINCLAVKLSKESEIQTQIISDSIPIVNWEIYWIENISDQEHIKTCKIEKNINSSNIIEKLIGYSISN